MPSGPALDSIRYTNSPTTTGGSPISALSSTVTAPRPRKRNAPTTAPRGRPIRQAMATAVSVTRSDRRTISLRSRSHVRIRPSASAMMSPKLNKCDFSPCREKKHKKAYQSRADLRGCSDRPQSPETEGLTKFGAFGAFGRVAGKQPGDGLALRLGHRAADGVDAGEGVDERLCVGHRRGPRPCFRRGAGRMPRRTERINRGHGGAADLGFILDRAHHLKK